MNLRELSARLRSLPELVVRAGATELTEAIKEQAGQDSGGDLRLSGSGRSPAKLATTTKVSGGASYASAKVDTSPRSRRIWSWLEKGTNAHTVGRRRDGGGLHMTPGAGWRTGPFRVSGSPAKNTWTDGVEAGLSRAEEAMRDVFRKETGG